MVVRWIVGGFLLLSLVALPATAASPSVGENRVTPVLSDAVPDVEMGHEIEATPAPDTGRCDDDCGTAEISPMTVVGVMYLVLVAVSIPVAIAYSVYRFVRDTR